MAKIKIKLVFKRGIGTAPLTLLNFSIGLNPKNSKKVFLKQFNSFYE